MKTRLVKAVSSGVFAGALVILVAAAMAFLMPESARAQSPAQVCGPQTLSGTYIFNTHGFNVIAGVAVPKAILEGIDFNGDGTLSSPFATVSINGVIIRTTDSAGTYTVEEDCTGTLTFTDGPSFDIFVGRMGREVSMIQTGPATIPAVFEGVAKKVSN